MPEERYSDRRLREDFTIYVLFSEPLEGTASELFEAAAEDYPGLDWSFDNLGPNAINTRDVTLAVAFEKEGDPHGMTRINGMPGRCELDWEPVINVSQRSVNPEARAVIERHTDHLSLAVSAPKGDTSLAARFMAARRVTCLGAVLAKLPTALGVYLPSADLLVPPKPWIEAADTAMKGEVPVFQWIALYALPVEGHRDNRTCATVGTIGLAAFNGRELVMPQVCIPPSDSAQWIYGVTRMLLEADHVFRDGDTLGSERDHKPIRIRDVREGEQGCQTDTWMLFHESSLLDDETLLGKRGGTPPTPDMDTSIEGNWDTLKNKLYGFVAGR